MTLDWSDLNSHNLTELKGACFNLGLRVTTRMKKENVVAILEDYKKSKPHKVKNNENQPQNTPIDHQKIKDFINKIPPPKIPSSGSFRTPSNKKSIWIHTPAQIFGNDDITVSKTPGYVAYAKELTKIDSVVPRIPHVPCVQAHKDAVKFNAVPKTPVVLSDAVTPIVKNAKLQEQMDKIVKPAFQSPIITERSQQMQVQIPKRKKRSNVVVFLAFFLFISSISALLFFAQ